MKVTLCPVAALLTYMAERGKGRGPLFCFRDGRPLTRTRFVAKVIGALTTAGVDQAGYCGHSWGDDDTSDATIKMLGRWKSNAY